MSVDIMKESFNGFNKREKEARMNDKFKNSEKASYDKDEYNKLLNELKTAYNEMSKFLVDNKVADIGKFEDTELAKKLV